MWNLLWLCKSSSALAKYYDCFILKNLFKYFEWKQGNSMSEMEWASFKCLFWNANDSVLKLIVSVTSGAPF